MDKFNPKLPTINGDQTLKIIDSDKLKLDGLP